MYIILLIDQVLLVIVVNKLFSVVDDKQLGFTWEPYIAGDRIFMIYHLNILVTRTEIIRLFFVFLTIFTVLALIESCIYSSHPIKCFSTLRPIGVENGAAGCKATESLGEALLFGVYASGHAGLSGTLGSCHVLVPNRSFDALHAEGYLAIF